MNFKEVRALMEQFDQSSMRELSLQTEGGGSLYLSKNKNSAPAHSAVLPVSTPTTAASDTAVSEAASSAPVATLAEGEAVSSPLVGVAYLKPAPDQADFISVGSSVKKGQTLLIIEAMKVMNEIPAPKDGVITEVLVNSEDVVEFGQDLVRIK